MNVKLGDTVELLGAQAGKVGVVQFIGETKFASGKWLGIVLPTASGKNDGSVQGVKYFNCKPEHGLFVKPTMVKVSTPAKPKHAKKPSNVGSSGRPAAASPTASSIKTPSKLRSGLPSPSSSRPSSIKETPTRPRSEKKTSSIKSSPSASSLTSPRGNKSSLMSAAAKASSTTTSADLKKHERDLKAAVKAKEAAEAQLADAQKEISTLKEKTKRQTMTMMELKKAEMKASQENTKLAATIQELEEMVENLSVDKDLAEEEVMDAKLEVEALKEQLEASQLEIQLIQQTKELKHEEMIQNLPTDQAEVARIQQQNETLTDALRQLRDLSVHEKKRFESTYEQQKRTIAKLSGEAALLKETQSALAKANTEVEDLKLALDDAETYEQMVEELSDKNLFLSEEVESLKERVATLQEMVDTADEIEEGHQEYEQQLQSELTSKEFEVGEVRQKLKTAQVKIDDLQKTLNQFRTLTSRLQDQMMSLNEARLDTANRSKDEISRSKEAFARMMKLQQHMGDLRKQALEFGLGELEARLATIRLDFVKLYIPDSLALDETSLGFLTLLEKVQFKGLLTIKLLDQHYGPDAAAVAGGKEEGMRLAEFSRNASETILQLNSSVHSLYNSLCQSESENFTAACSKYMSLERVEAVLDEFLSMVTSDSISPMTPLKAIRESIELVRDFSKRYFGSGSVGQDQLPRADTLPRLRLSLRSVELNQAAVKANIRLISDAVSLVTLSGEETGTSAALRDNLSVMEDAQVKAEGLMAAIMTKLDTLEKKSYYREIVNLSEALGAVVSNYSPVPERSATLFGAVQNAGEDASTLGRLLENERKERVGIPNRLLAVVSALEKLSECVDERIQTADRAASAERQDPVTVWEARAFEIKEELSEAASMRKKLEDSNQQIQSKSRELFQSKKQTREYKAKLDALTQRLKLVEDKAGGSAVLEAEVNRYRQMEDEFQQSTDVMQKDLEKYMRDNKTLKTKLAKLSLQMRGNKGSAFDGAAGVSGSVAHGEVHLLRRAVRSLRQQLADIRSKTAALDLETTLPPLPQVRRRIHSEGQHTSAENLARSLSDERSSLQDTYRRKVLTRLDGDISKLTSKLTVIRSAPTLVDLSAGGVGSRRKYLQSKSQVAALQSKAKKLGSTLYSLIGSGPVGAAPAGAKPTVSVSDESSVLVGRVVLPHSTRNKTERLVIGRTELQELQQVFV